MSPVFISFEVAYMGFYKGMIDHCTSCSQPSMIDRKWFEVVPYLTDRASTYAPCPNIQTFMNLDFWNAIEKPYQDLIIDAAARLQIWSIFESTVDWEVTRYKLLNYYDCKISPIVGKPGYDEQMDDIRTALSDLYLSVGMTQENLDTWYAKMAALNVLAKTDAYIAEWQPFDDAAMAEAQRRIDIAEAQIAEGVDKEVAFTDVGYRRMLEKGYEDTMAEVDYVLSIYPPAQAR